MIPTSAWRDSSTPGGHRFAPAVMERAGHAANDARVQAGGARCVALSITQQFPYVLDTGNQQVLNRHPRSAAPACLLVSVAIGGIGKRPFGANLTTAHPRPSLAGAQRGIRPIDGFLVHLA